MINIKVTKKYIHSGEIEVSEYSFDSNEKSIEFCEKIKEEQIQKCTY